MTVIMQFLLPWIIDVYQRYIMLKFRANIQSGRVQVHFFINYKCNLATTLKGKWLILIYSTHKGPLTGRILDFQLFNFACSVFVKNIPIQKIKNIQKSLKYPLNPKQFFTVAITSFDFPAAFDIKPFGNFLKTCFLHQHFWDLQIWNITSFAIEPEFEI